MDIHNHIAIAVVVVTYNRPLELCKVLSAIECQTYAPDLLIVVDNDSKPPASVSYVGNAQLMIIRHKKNLGGAGGFASGIDHALRDKRIDWIWLLDDDAVPEPGALEKLYKATCCIDSSAGSISSSVIEFGQLAIRHRRRFNFQIGFEKSVSKKSYRNQIVPIDTSSFVGCMVNTKAVRKVGLPRKDFFLSYDDTEYSLRLMSAGYSNWLIPDSKIIHLRDDASKLSQTPFGIKHYYNIRNRIVVAKKYSRFSGLAGLLAVSTGLFLALYCGVLRKLQNIALLKKAVFDGLTVKLGIYQ